MSVQGPPPIRCPVCTAPCVIINKEFTCVYCMITAINWIPFKSLDKVKFTPEEIEEMEAKEKEKQKKMIAELEKKKNEAKKKFLEEQSKNGKTKEIS